MFYTAKTFSVHKGFAGLSPPTLETLKEIARQATSEPNTGNDGQSPLCSSCPPKPWRRRMWLKSSQAVSLHFLLRCAARRACLEWTAAICLPLALAGAFCRPLPRRVACRPSSLQRLTLLGQSILLRRRARRIGLGHLHKT